MRYTVIGKRKHHSWWEDFPTLDDAIWFALLNPEARWLVVRTVAMQRPYWHKVRP